MDRGPASHPIRGRVPDVAQAMANFDNITYDKGQAVLHQLMEYVGEDTFVAGLRAYFADYAWGNTRLSDLIDAVGTAAGRDLASWSEAWFDRAGTDTLTLVGDALLATSPDGDQPRRHRLRVGSYRRKDGGLEAVGDAELETTGTATHLADLPDADLHLVNDGDLTYAAARTDEASLETMLALARHLPDTISRALVVTTGWDMLAKGELSSGDFLDCALRVAEAEPSAGVVERMFALALEAAEQWSPTSMVPRRLARVAESAMRRVEEPDHHKAALNVLAASAGTEEQFDLLETEAENDLDLAWRVMTRRASLGRYDAAAVEALQERDPDPEAYVRAWSVTAARPSEEAKAEAWAHVFTAKDVPIGTPLAQFANAFWRPVQHDLLVPWAYRFLDDVNELGSAGMLATLSITSTMAPTTCDEGWLERARDLAAQPDTSPTVRRVLLVTADTLSRVLRARE